MTTRVFNSLFSFFLYSFLSFFYLLLALSDSFPLSDNQSSSPEVPKTGFFSIETTFASLQLPSEKR